MSYSNLASHAAMIFDETRNRAYLDAMRAVITPDSVVLDLGAGVGVLGFLAAKLGARRVYCVEPAPVGLHIPALAAANGLGDRVQLLRGRVEDIVLPEQVDVLVSVFTGTLLFTEGLMPSLYHARDRWLKPGGAMIPDRARLHFAAVEATEPHAETVGIFAQSSLGIDYARLAGLPANGMSKLSRKNAKALPASTSCMAVELDLRTTHQHDLRWEGVMEATRDASLHGLLGWIELHLGSTWLSTAIDQQEVHWQPMLLPVSEPMQVRCGELIHAGFRFVDDAQVYWSLSVEGRTQRQSTVLGDPDIAIDLMLSSPACNAPLRADGILVAQVLAAIQTGQSNREIADGLMVAMPGRFRDEREALKRVGALAARYRRHPSRPD